MFPVDQLIGRRENDLKITFFQIFDHVFPIDQLIGSRENALTFTFFQIFDHVFPFNQLIGRPENALEDLLVPLLLAPQVRSTTILNLS